MTWHHAHNFKNIIGQRFNGWNVIALCPTNSKVHTKWLCMCDCGKGPFSVRIDALISGHSPHCRFHTAGISKPLKTPRISKIASCHPKRPYGAHGLCRICYSKAYQRTKTVTFLRETNAPVNFYVYLWLRGDGRPYYVGKGFGNRGFTSKGHHVGRPLDRNQIITQEFISESDAFEAEKFFISYYGRRDCGTGILRNRNNGGFGGINNKGKKHSEEHRRRISIALMGKKLSETHRLAISEAKKKKRLCLGQS